MAGLNISQFLLVMRPGQHQSLQGLPHHTGFYEQMTCHLQLDGVLDRRSVRAYLEADHAGTSHIGLQSQSQRTLYIAKKMAEKLVNLFYRLTQRPQAEIFQLKNDEAHLNRKKPRRETHFERMRTVVTFQSIASHHRLR